MTKTGPELPGLFFKISFFFKKVLYKPQKYVIII